MSRRKYVTDICVYGVSLSFC